LPAGVAHGDEDVRLFVLEVGRRAPRRPGVWFGARGVAQGFGARGVRVEKAEDLAPTVRQAFAVEQPTVIHVPCALLGPTD
jgi:hypothetical protein